MKRKENNQEHKGSNQTKQPNKLCPVTRTEQAKGVFTCIAVNPPALEERRFGLRLRARATENIFVKFAHVPETLLHFQQKDMLQPLNKQHRMHVAQGSDH